MMLAIQLGLTHQPQVATAIVPDWSRNGIGISDDVNLSSRLGLFSFYSNTFFDTFPHLDLLDVPTELHNSFEFVSCSDVLEHVSQDPTIAAKALFDLTRDDGFVVVSVPVATIFNHLNEYYPGLTTWQSLEDGSINWVNSEGKEFLDSNPDWHGGRGLTLAFREFGKESLVALMESVGFQECYFVNENHALGVPLLPDNDGGILLCRKTKSI